MNRSDEAGTEAAPGSTERYRFADVSVDAAAHTLVRDGQPLSVEPKAFAVLLVLLRHAGELVSRDDLLDDIWGHRHVTPGVLTRVIAQLRHALDDDAHEPRFIQTQHSLGYRFVGDLDVPETPSSPEAEPPSPHQSPQLAQPPQTASPAGDAGSVAVIAAGPTPPTSPGDRRVTLATGAAAQPVAGPTPLTSPGDRRVTLATGAAAQPVAGSTHPTSSGDRRVALAAGAAAQPAAVPTPPASSGDRRAALAAGAAAPPAAGDRRVAASRQAATPNWRMWLLVIAALLLVGWSAVAWLERAPASSPARAQQASIAVLPFTSLGPRREDRLIAEGLAIEMHDALAGIRGLKVAALPRSALVGTGEPDIKALGKTMGVATVLAASVRRDGGRVRINARLSDARTGFTLWSKSYDRGDVDVLVLQTEIANEVVQSLLGVLPKGPRLAKRLAPTRNAAAYEAYLMGMQQLQSSGDPTRFDNAIGFFGQALAADGSFARAQAGVCRAEIGRFESAREPAAFQRAQSACDRASRMDPGLREVSLALGELYRAAGETDRAIEQYSRALEDVSLRASAYIGLGRAQSALGENRLAMDYFLRASDLRPGDPVVYRELGYHHYLNDDLPQAIESYRAAATLQPDDPAPWSSLGGLYLASGDTAQAGSAFLRSLAIKPTYGALGNLGSLKYAQGDYVEAAALYRRAAELEPDDYRVWGNLGDALSALPASRAQAAEPYERAARMVEAYVEIKPDDAQAHGLLAWYRANLGRGPAARAALARADALATERGEVAFLGAQTMALLGDAAGAHALVEQALAHDIPPQRIQSAPVLRALDIDARRTPPAVTDASEPRAGR